MPRCAYRLSPRVDPRRPRCLLDEGHDGDHAPDTAGQVRRGRPAADAEPTRAIPVRAPVSVLARYEAAPEHVRERAREAAAVAFSAAFSDGESKKDT